MAFSIIRHAFAMVFGNFGQALRLSIGPFALTALVIYIVAQMLDIGMISIAFMMMQPASADPVIALFVIAAIIASTFTTAWVAVGWHRFILLEEYVQLLPQVRDRPIMGYILTSLAISFWVIIASFIAGLIVGFALAATGLQDAVVPAFIGGLLIGLVVSFVWFRLGLSLPALAIGERMRLRESLAATKPISSTILQVVLIVALLNALGQSAIGTLAGLGMTVTIIASLALYWVSFMVGLSILTTFYGHLIEGRDL